MKKRIISAVAISLAFAILTGCSERGSKEGDMVIGQRKFTVLSPIEITDDNVQNSIRVFDAVSEDMANSMFSPLSLNMALGLLAEGAGGTSKEALNKYLGTDDYGAFAESYMKVISDYNAPSGYEDKYKNVFEIANSFWANKNITFNESYKSDITQKFGAEVRNIDFADKNGTLKEINGWVKEKTHKMIPSIISDYDEKIIAAVLINTIYFESRWGSEWTVVENDKETFTMLDGSSKELPLMRQHVYSYFENNAATAFRYGYQNGLDFIGILPKETGDFTVESLDIPSLLESETYDYDVYARMPRLKFDTNLPLTEALSAAGLSELFDVDKVDLTRIANVPSFPLYISDVLQKTSLELDEYGTRASAVTAELAAGAGMPREKRTVVLDRPFAFMIYDSEENQIVFLGKVTEP